jgi:hypothetical protein
MVTVDEGAAEASPVIGILPPPDKVALKMPETVKGSKKRGSQNQKGQGVNLSPGVHHEYHTRPPDP